MKKNLNLLMIFIFCLSLSISLSLSGKSDVQKTQTSSKKEGATSLTSGVKPAVDPALFQAMKYRFIGPVTGGRVPAVAGVQGQPLTFYMGSCGGGLYKTDDGGHTWFNISDGFFEAPSIGAIAVAPSNPNILYVGTGEACIRSDVQTGVGVYKSVDAGKTWKHIGPVTSGQIGKIRIHPTNPDLVYVAVLGHAFGPNQERGVYRSKDGGNNWEKVLFVSARAGAVDIAMDINNPHVLYAAIWQAVRLPWKLISGGEDSGLYKTADSGDNWSQLTNGLPNGVVGRIGVTVSPANPDRLWVNIEADDGGVYRSDDGGKNFFCVNRERKLRTRAFYFTHIIADSVDENTVYCLNIRGWKSIDGGRTFERFMGGDAHDLWINPDNNNYMILGDDAGARTTFNGGRTWSTVNNQPNGDFYVVATDSQFPYRVYGSDQDGPTISIPSQSWNEVQDTYEIIGGGEQGEVAIHPDNPNIVYGGEYEGQIVQYNHLTGQGRNIEIYNQLGEGVATEDLKYRIRVHAPIRLSPHDPNILYHGSQYVLRSTNGGQSWEVISPDLTTNDKSKQGPSGGPITLDHTGVEVHCCIKALEESPHEPGVIWVGSDDGLVHITRDNGKTWENITPKNLPPDSWVNRIGLSAHDPARAFLAVIRYQLDDFTPYVYRTNDYGKSWTLVTRNNGIPSHHFVRVVREDPVRKGLLYAGTEFGMYISFDDGGYWQPFNLNLPAVQIADMVIKDNDLVVATHGRGFWILDDLTPLHQIRDAQNATRAYLYKPRAAYRPRIGATFFYSLSEVPDEEVTLEILESEGDIVRTFSSREGRKIPANKGINRVEWDLRYPAADLVEDAILFGPSRGPLAVPGTYQVRLRIGKWTQTQSFEVKRDPRVNTEIRDLQEQFDLAIKIRDSISGMTKQLRTLRSVRDQVKSLAKQIEGTGNYDQIVAKAKEIHTKLTEIEDQLLQTKIEWSTDACNFPPRLIGNVDHVLDDLLTADAKPTEGVYARFSALQPAIEQQQNRINEVLTLDLRQFNDLIRASGIPPVIVRGNE